MAGHRDCQGEIEEETYKLIDIKLVEVVDLLDNVKKKIGEIRQLRAKLPVKQPNSEPEDNHSQDIEEEESLEAEKLIYIKQDTVRPRAQNETEKEEESIDHGDNENAQQQNLKSTKNLKSSELSRGGTGKSKEQEKKKKYPCGEGECSYAASQKSNLKKHKSTVHDKIRNHKCDQCDYAAFHAFELKRHIESKHENARKHLCEHCGYAASLKSLLKRHIESEHETTRKHVCENCGYAAKWKAGLKRHIECVHENTRRHVCEHCGFSANQKWNLTKHMERVHHRSFCRSSHGQVEEPHRSQPEPEGAPEPHPQARQQKAVQDEGDGPQVSEEPQVLQEAQPEHRPADQEGQAERGQQIVHNNIKKKKSFNIADILK